MGPVEQEIRTTLAQGLQPLHLDVENQSALHKGHPGDNGSGESHFHAVIVAEAFAGQGRVARQRMVYELLAEALESRIHALSLKLYSPCEWNG